VSAAAPPATSEIRLTTLHATRGANFWSTRPVTRMDVVVGVYDHVSSADAPGVTEQLLAALPGLAEHQCSIGEPGGFVTRLRRGTFAPHIAEHVALELQTMIGHDVGFGRTRGGDVEGEYTIVFEHLHEQVGLRAAALALETVQRAFDGSLEPAHVALAVRELTALARTSDAPPITQRVLAGITGGSGRAECITALHDSLGESEKDALFIDVAPSFVLYAGLPYARSRVAVILDTTLTDVPPRYQEPERARRLVATLIDAVPRGGFVVCPASEIVLQDEARRAGCRVGVFATDEREIGPEALEIASAVGRLRDGEIWLEHCDDGEWARPLRPREAEAPQIAAALAAYVLRGAPPSR
jgi:hypothetical protein